MTIIPRSALVALGVAAAFVCLGAGQEKEADRKKPELVLTVAPVIAFVPARIKFAVDIRDGADDYEEFYCASVQWDWDDGTTSEWSRDCDPYRPGKSQFQRHFSAVHNLRHGGELPPDIPPEEARESRGAGLRGHRAAARSTPVAAGLRARVR